MSFASFIAALPFASYLGRVASIPHLRRVVRILRLGRVVRILHHVMRCAPRFRTRTGPRVPDELLPDLLDHFLVDLRLAEKGQSLLVLMLLLQHVDCLMQRLDLLRKLLNFLGQPSHLRCLPMVGCFLCSFRYV